MNREKSALVIPAYNEVLTIERTLQSVCDMAEQPDMTIVVDNASTDGTAEAVKASFPDVVVISEEEKGTGIACNTGFNHATNEGAEIILRTDADTVPWQNWLSTTLDYFEQHPNKQLVSGKSRSLNDEYYRGADRLMIPLVQGLIRFGGVAVKRDIGLLRLVVGHNMAVRSHAFEAVGRFPNSRIDDTDEDYELLKKIKNMYGFQALGRNPDMIVDTSARRIRKVGYIGILQYHGTSGEGADEYRRAKMGGEIDIR